MRIEVLLDLKTRLGESPVWDVEQQRLWWVDSLDGRLFACNAQGERANFLSHVPALDRAALR
uniref:SMP-30/gluconolactonase/LRE family protein n=1 Tax=Klebsiella pneumoniae TaxID=573 RepID=UPI0025521291